MHGSGMEWGGTARSGSESEGVSSCRGEVVSPPPPRPRVQCRILSLKSSLSLSRGCLIIFTHRRALRTLRARRTCWVGRAAFTFQYWRGCTISQQRRHVAVQAEQEQRRVHPPPPHTPPTRCSPPHRCARNLKEDPCSLEVSLEHLHRGRVF